MPDQSFEIGELHAHYAGGGSVEAVIDAVFARLAEADDPGIFIHLEGRRHSRPRRRGSDRSIRRGRSGGFRSR